MTSLAEVKRIMAETRAPYDDAALRFLNTLPTLADIESLKSDLVSAAQDPDYKITSAHLVSERQINFPDFYQCNPALDLKTSLETIENRTKDAFPGAMVQAQIQDFGQVWVRITVSMYLK